MRKMDLHMHSSYSDDGQYEPQELLQMCQDANLEFMAIADHNSVKGSRIASALQKEFRVNCITAIEIDAQHLGVNYHILGYGIDLENPIFDKIEENVASQELQASKKRIQLVQALGITFDEKRLQELSPHGITTGEAIGEAAMEYDTDKKNPLLQPYYPNGKRSDNPFVNFYWDFCAPDKPAYVEIKYPSVSEVMEELHHQKALVIVAHPGINTQEKLERINDLIKLGVDGFEVFSSYHSPQQTQFYYEIAKQHHLLMSCGSDFHGKTKPSVHIGMVEMEEKENMRLAHILETL